jgi:hypothetical protein
VTLFDNQTASSLIQSSLVKDTAFGIEAMRQRSLKENFCGKKQENKKAP